MQLQIHQGSTPHAEPTSVAAKTPKDVPIPRSSMVEHQMRQRVRGKGVQQYSVWQKNGLWVGVFLYKPHLHITHPFVAL